ncbi:YqeB family protein [Catellatospora methionotrophica]|uniref:YqeB family protein n=1 Tax=Catellatospora methionotrophica TaxID=121620 RepID=UPI0033F4DD62
MAGQDAQTVVAVPAGERALIAWGFPIAGMAVGWLLKAAAGWIAGLSWAPFQGPFKLVAQIPEPWATVGALALGLVTGVLLVLTAVGERLTVTVSDDAAVLARVDGPSRTVARAHVAAVFTDGKQLVLQGADGWEHAREGSDLRPAELRAAFTAHGYPWRDDGDPHRDLFRLWVPDLPGLPEGANALLAARAKALSKREHADASVLREELRRQGVLVREDGRRQYWRVATSPSTDGPTR